MLKTARETIKLPPALQFGARLIDRSLIINQMEILYIYTIIYIDLYNTNCCLLSCSVMKYF